MALEAAAARTQHERVVGLNLLMSGNAGEDHLRTAAEAREVVVADRADGDQQIGLCRGGVDPQRDPGPEIADSHQPRRVPAVVLPDRDPDRQGPDQRRHPRLVRRWMGAARHQDRHRFRVDPRREQSIDDRRQDLRQAGVTGFIGDHDHRRTATGGELAQRPAVERPVHGPRDPPPRLPVALRRGRCQRSHAQPAQIDRDGFVSVRQLDDHRLTIPSCGQEVRA